MNNAKERRIEKEARRHGDAKRYICPFPGCGRAFWKEEGKDDLCNYHKQFVGDLVFALNHLRPPQEVVGPQDGTKIFVPKPGMENQAIEEAKRAAKRGP